MGNEFKALAGLLPALSTEPKLAIGLAALALLAYSISAIRQSVLAGAFPLTILAVLAVCGVVFSGWFALQF